jgi:hypothetical protein
MHPDILGLIVDIHSSKKLSLTEAVEDTEKNIKLFAAERPAETGCKQRQIIENLPGWHV